MAEPVRALTVSGTIPSEKYGELFQHIVAPLGRMKANGLRLEVRVLADNFANDLTTGDPPIKLLKEYARRLGLELTLFDTEQEPTP